jgi:hypothetical protein
MSSAAAAPTGVDVSAANDDDEDDDVDEDYSRGVLDVTPNPPPDDDDYDIDDVENIANVATEDGRNVSRSSSAANSSASASRRRTHSTQPIEYGMENDDALARAIAEQDLPPGVSVAEQQEVMMRLLTQRIRRGDRDDDDGHGGGGVGEKLSPALEARLRDFNFAQGKRRERYGEDRPWGILGLYDHLGEFIHPLSFLSLLFFFIFVTMLISPPTFPHSSFFVVRSFVRSLVHWSRPYPPHHHPVLSSPPFISIARTSSRAAVANEHDTKNNET